MGQKSMGMIAGFRPIAEIEAILRDRTGFAVVRSANDANDMFTLVVGYRMLKVVYDAGSNAYSPIEADRTVFSLGADEEGMALVRDIIGYYGGFFLEDDIDEDWQRIEETGKALPLTDLDRYELALTEKLSMEQAKVLRDIAEDPEMRAAVQAIGDQHLPVVTAPGLR